MRATSAPNPAATGGGQSPGDPASAMADVAASSGAAGAVVASGATGMSGATERAGPTGMSGATGTSGATERACQTEQYGALAHGASGAPGRGQHAGWLGRHWSTADRALEDLERHPRFRVQQANAMRSAIVLTALLMAVVLAINAVDYATRFTGQRWLIVLGAGAEILVTVAIVWLARRAPRAALEPLAATIGYAAMLTTMIAGAFVMLVAGTVHSYNPSYLASTPVFIALLIPWRARAHCVWLAGYAAAALAFLAISASGPLTPAESRNALIATVVGLVLSYFGNLTAHRARLEVFGQGLRLRAQRAELARLNREITAVARLDPLTGVANRRLLDEDLVPLWDRVVRYGHSYAALMIDIDRFKLINDSSGHAAGDATLRAVAHALHGTMRAGDAIYRYGGEEFLIILPAQTPAEARTAADRYRFAVAALEVPSEGNPPWGVLTVSVGVAVAEPESDVTAAQWLSRADRALYVAKRGGRNRVEVDVVLRPSEAAEPAVQTGWSD